MKANVISVKLNSFTKDRVKQLIEAAQKYFDRDLARAEKYLLDAEYYIKQHFNINEVFNGALNDIFGYGTGCPLKHLIKIGTKEEIILFFIKLGVNPTSKSNIDEEFLNFA
jgi:hypothetical protein